MRVTVLDLYFLGAESPGKSLKESKDRKNQSFP